MGLSTKQLEELENIQDAAEELHNAIENSDKFDEATESTIACRRSILEKAVINVKKTSLCGINLKTIYEIGSLLFDKKNNKFARVIKSKQNYIKLRYLSGGFIVFKKNKKIINNKNDDLKKKKKLIISTEVKNTDLKEKNNLKLKTKILKNNKKLIIDPLIDPNGYIKQNFQYMSNKEIASMTKLSQHTIRRKLGEWGLKRLNRIKNKKNST